MASGEIRGAEGSDIDGIVDLMDLAFADDPTTNWVLGTPEIFAADHRKFTRILIECCLREGCVDVFGQMDGAAVWLRPGGSIDEDRILHLREEFHAPDLFDRFVGLVEACADYRPDRPYWELELIAVHPSRCGHDIGGRLLRHGIARAGMTAAPIYLESSNARNISFYTRHGFELLARVSVEGSPERFPMRLAHARAPA